MAKSLFFLAGLGDATKSENWKNNFIEYKIISRFLSKGQRAEAINAGVPTR